MPAPVYGFEEELLAYGQLLPDHLLGAKPAAGQPFILGLDSRWWWRFVGVKFVLTTDANVANRLVTVDYCDSEGTAWLRSPAAAVQAAAAAAAQYDFARRDFNMAPLAAGGQYADLIHQYVPPGWQLRINVLNIQVGDQLDQIRLYVEKFEPCANESVLAPDQG